MYYILRRPRGSHDSLDWTIYAQYGDYEKFVADYKYLVENIPEIEYQKVKRI